MTIDELLTDKLREAWQTAQCFPGSGRIRELANGLRDFVAALMESEFGHTHRCADNPDWGESRFQCLDPRHNYKWPDWQRAAEERLAK